jgi:hypothetical protein
VFTGTGLCAFKDFKLWANHHPFRCYCSVRKSTAAASKNLASESARGFGSIDYCDAIMRSIRDARVRHSNVVVPVDIAPVAALVNGNVPIPTAYVQEREASIKMEV